MPDGGIAEAAVADAVFAEAGAEVVGTAATVEAGAAADAAMTGGISGELAGSGILGSAAETIASMVSADSAIGGTVAGAADAAGGISGTIAGTDAAATGVEAGKYAALTDGASSGVEAINNAAPGSIAKGLSDAEVANSVFAPAAAAAGGAAAGASVAPTDVASAAPGTTEATNAAFGDGAGSATTDNSILDWAQKNPKLAASMLQGTGLTLGGAAKGAADYMTAEKKAELDRQTLLEVQRQKPLLYQQFVQASSAGGNGVTVPFGAPAQRKPLTNSAGQPVFGQGGIIGSRIGT